MIRSSWAIKKAQKPVFRNTIPSFFARLRRHLGFFYWGSRALGIRQQSRSTISNANQKTLAGAGHVTIQNFIAWGGGVRKVSNYMLPLRMTSFATAAMLEYIAFFSCLEFAVLNSTYENRILKPKIVLWMECLYLKVDLMCVLPTGYGKSLILHLLSANVVVCEIQLG